MTLTFRQPELLKALELALPITRTKSVMPILKNVALAINGHQCEIYTTNLETYVKVKVRPESSVPDFSAAVNADRLHEIVKNLRSDSPVEISSADKARIVVSQNPNTSFRLNAVSLEDFPLFPEKVHGPETVEMEMAVADLTEALEAVTFSASDSESRYRLNSVYLTSRNDRFTLVSTDSHRLSCHDIDGKFAPPDGISGYLLPKSSAAYLLKWLPKFRTEKILLTINQKSLTVETEDHVVSVRLMDGAYPDYQKVIPSDMPAGFSVDRSMLIAAIKRVGLVTSERSRGIRMTREHSQSKLELSAINADIGEAHETISIEPLAEFGFSKIINRDYALESLNSLKTSRVFLSVYDDMRKPVVMTAENPGARLTLVMPMREN